MKMFVAYNGWGELVADSPDEDGLYDELDLLGVDPDDVEVFVVSA